MAIDKALHKALLAEMDARLNPLGIHASLIWSIDEARDIGLLDVLPLRATKYHAIRFLMAHSGFDTDNTVFAGDSGNDLPALTSGLQAVLERNARPEVREQGMAERLYLARGNFLRSIIMHIEEMTPQQILGYELATGAPHLYVFNDDLDLIDKQIFSNPDKET